MSQCAQSFFANVKVSLSRVADDHSFSPTTSAVFFSGVLFGFTSIDWWWWCSSIWNAATATLTSHSLQSPVFNRAAFLIITGFVLTYFATINCHFILLPFVFWLLIVCFLICTFLCDCSGDVSSHFWEHIFWRQIHSARRWMLDTTNWRHTLSSFFFLSKLLQIPDNDVRHQEKRERVRQVIGTITITTAVLVRTI